MAYTKLTLPDRPLTMKPGAIAAQRGSIFTIIIMLLIGGFLAWWQGPDIWRDWQISQNPVTVDDSDVQNGECTTRKAFFTDCEAHVVYNYQGQHYESDIKLMFIDVGSSDYWVEVVISGDKPELATLSLGIDKLWNRIAMFAAFAALFFGGALVMLWLAMRAKRASRALTEPARMTLVPLEITNMLTARGTTQVTYQDTERSKRALAANFPNGQEPLMVWDDQGNGYGLGVRSSAAPLAALLDRGLTRIDLTDQERRDALAVLSAEEQEQSGQPQPEAAPKKRGRAFLRGLLAVIGVILLFVLGGLGWWLWYVTNGPSQYDQLGMEINAALPEGMNAWGCDKLQERFGDQNAPYGCTAADHVSWK